VLAGIAAGAPSVARGYVPEWAESGEDTTILPAQRSYPDVIRREPYPEIVPPSEAELAAASAGPAVAAAASAGGTDVPARNSRFGDLRSGPVMGAAASEPALRSAYNNEGSKPEDGKSRNAGANGHTRRVMVAAGAVLMLGLGTYLWSLSQGTDEAKRSAANPLPSVIPATGKCVVSYAVWSDANKQFKAQVTLANRDETPVSNWKLWFLMPGDQVVAGDGKVQLIQSDRGVTVESSAPLKPQTTLSVPLVGTYTTNNLPPLAFSLNGRTCETFVSSKPGEPSKQVVNLSNGKQQLVVPGTATATPVPGISIDPTGIVHITPTTAPVRTSPASGASSSASPSVSASPSSSPSPSKSLEPDPIGGPSDSESPSPSPSESSESSSPVVTTPPTPSLEACEVGIDPTCTDDPTDAAPPPF
jgi:eukaryotic-like serine/threonine-protein kinase